MKLTPIQYDVLLQALNNARAELIDDTFIDPYAENPKGYTNATLLKAVGEVEWLIIQDDIPH